MTGQSSIAFLNEYRLNAAAEALQTTDETILTIASQISPYFIASRHTSERKK